MKLQDLEIYENDFDLFVALDPKEKVEFLFDATRIGLEASVLKQEDKLCNNIFSEGPPVITQDFNVGKYKLCVTTLSDEIHLNSNSLRAIRRFVSKLWNDGMLLSKLDIKKTKIDIHRFYRAYKILGRISPICPN